MLSSDPSFGEQREVLADPVIATAKLDRLLHHSHTVNVRGESYRPRGNRMMGIEGETGAEVQLIGPLKLVRRPDTDPKQLEVAWAFSRVMHEDAEVFERHAE